MHQELSNEQLHKVAPSIFATKPWEKVSSKYAFIPTIQVVDALRDEGFMPVRAQQSKTRIEGKGDFTKHLIRFRKSGDLQRAVGDEIPEIVLVNSHDRTSSYQLSAGIFRLVCSNGMVVKSANFGDIKVQHSGDVVDRVIEGSYRIIEEMPRVVERMDAMKALTMEPNVQQAFAKAALELRYPSDEQGNSTAPITPDQLLMTRRYDDRKNDLWTTFNRVQENFIRGGLHGTASTGRRMRTRGINSVNEDLRLNKALWVLAEEMESLLVGGPFPTVN